MLVYALPLSFFLVMLETALGSYIVLYVLDVYGGIATRRLMAPAPPALQKQEAGEQKQEAGEEAGEDDEAEAHEGAKKQISAKQAEKRVGVTKGFLVFQGLLYLVLALLAYWFGSYFAAESVFNGITGFYQQYPLDRAWLSSQFTLLLVFAGLLLVYNVLLWFNARLLRWVVGGLAALVALAELLVIGMAYRPLAAENLGGFFTVASIVAGALALGGVLTAMLLGHWYLNTPTASGKPLELATLIMLIGLGLELVLSIFIHSTIPSGLPQTGTPPISPGALNVIRLVFGFVFTLGLGGLAYRLTRGRSFQSATGMLYLAVAFAFTGEIMARGLFFLPPLS
jgi:DMSO reductase anchor subunit